MKVWNVDEQGIRDIAARLDMRPSNVRREGRAIAFKMDAVDSRAKYARRSSPDSWSGKTQGRRLSALCYHGWRDLIRACWDAGAVRVQSTQGNWKTREAFEEDLPRLAGVNLGSIMYPFPFIRACEDKHGDWSDDADDDHKVQFGTLDQSGQLSNVRMIKQSDITRCPFVILVPTHYRDDGSCKCDDADERAKMIAEWEYSAEDFANIPLRHGWDRQGVAL